ncbi:hypothetical protein AB0F81_28525 [Actinoplanes sp. NPDC024001]|uniref:hypothetical protein n=1 Tax=Actinoplanes sp. NPDC024001 TaxID=3154598 RepID=UPI0033D4F690
MWICGNCGEWNADAPDGCEVCGHPRAVRASHPYPDPEVAWIPEAADPPEPGRGRRLVPALLIVVLVAALATAGVLAGPRLLSSPPDRAAKEVRPVVPTTENTTVSRLVTVDAAVTDPRAPAIAAMFETYFAGINEKDYAAVAEVFDPAGAFDPGDPEQMAAFSDGTATTVDSDVLLAGVTDLADGRLRADVTFRSEQEAGNGPPGRLAETCTRWRVGYVLSRADDEYRIFRGKGVSEPC